MSSHIFDQISYYLYDIFLPYVILWLFSYSYYYYRYINIIYRSIFTFFYDNHDDVGDEEAFKKKYYKEKYREK